MHVKRHVCATVRKKLWKRQRIVFRVKSTGTVANAIMASIVEGFVLPADLRVYPRNQRCPGQVDEVTSINTTQMISDKLN